eukprot:s3509_g5.t1
MYSALWVLEVACPLASASAFLRAASACSRGFWRLLVRWPLLLLSCVQLLLALDPAELAALWLKPGSSPQAAQAPAEELALQVALQPLELLGKARLELALQLALQPLELVGKAAAELAQLEALAQAALRSQAEELAQVVLPPLELLGKAAAELAQLEALAQVALSPLELLAAAELARLELALQLALQPLELVGKAAAELAHLKALAQVALPPLELLGKAAELSQLQELAQELLGLVGCLSLRHLWGLSKSWSWGLL